MAGMGSKKTSAGKKKIEQMKKSVSDVYKSAVTSTPKKLGAEAMPKKKQKVKN